MDLKHHNDWVPPQLSGFVCTFYPAAPGSSPKDPIYAFINLYLIASFGKDKYKRKRGRDCTIFLKKN